MFLNVVQNVTDADPNTSVVTTLRHRSYKPVGCNDLFLTS